MEGKSTDDVLAQAQKMEFMEGRIYNEASAKVFRKELLKMKSSGMVVKIQTRKDEYVCDECKRLSKMVFTVDEALEIMPIPHKCTNASCRCTYGYDFPDSD